MTLLLGIDAWSGYGAIDWKRAQSAGVKFAFLKCTTGNDGIDGKYKANAQACRDIGLPYAPYLFGYPLREIAGKPGRSPEDQARRMYADCDGQADMPPVLDLEWPPHFEKEKGTSKILDRWTQWNVDAAFIADWGLRCLAELERLFGRVPILYTYPNFWQSLGQAGKDEAWSKYPLWIANYTHPNEWLPPDGAKPYVPEPWSKWGIWQFSADGSSMRVPGVGACPLDRDCMTQETLDELLGKNEPTVEV